MANEKKGGNNKKLSVDDIKKMRSDLNREQEKSIALAELELANVSTLLDRLKTLTNEKEIQKKQDEIRKNNIKLYNSILEGNIELDDKALKYLKKQTAELKKQTDELKNHETLLGKFQEHIKSYTDHGGKMRNYFMKADEAIKSATLQLGLSGARAKVLRSSFEDSAGYAARLGMDMKELATMATVYADETGRARLLNEENQQALVMMAKGTAMGADEAARMAGQFEMMGFNATDTAKEVQRILDTSERMGVNTTKVFKAVNKNFKTLQKFTFQNGVQSMADMAIYAEKFKMDMGETIKSMEGMRTIEGAVDAAAKLQVLGGEFAKLADPMQMLFESRNDPEAYMKRINNMTKGLVTLKKTADGFSFDIASPQALDMMNQAAAALGMTTDELTQQAFRMREVQQMRSQMFNKGFSNDEKEIIEGLAKFSKETGRMYVEIGGVKKDISRLNNQDLRSLKLQKSSLEERAQAAQTFDQAFTATVEELKASLLPALNGINETLAWIRPYINNFQDIVGDLSKTNKGFLKAAGLIMGSVMLLKSIKFAMGLGNSLTGMIPFSGGKSGKGSAGKASKGAKGAAKGAVGGLGSGIGAGFKALGQGAGVGVAAMGIGQGMSLAAKGVGELAKSLENLDVEKLQTLEYVVTALGLSMIPFAIALGVVGTSTAAAAGPLLAFGGAVLMVGGGIGIAAAGIGYMAEGFSKLDGVDLSGIGAGMLGFASATMLISNPLAMAGMVATSLAVGSIASSADGIERVGSAFANIGAVLKGNASQFRDVKNTIKEIASMEITANGGIAQLMDVLSKPLTVKFDEKTVSLVANVGVNIDGRELKRVMTDPAYNAIQLVDQQKGKRGV